MRPESTPPAAFYRKGDRLLFMSMLGAAARIPQPHVSADPEKCISCGLCEKACS